MYDDCYDNEVEMAIEDHVLRKSTERQEAEAFAFSIPAEQGVEIWGRWGESNVIEVRDQNAGTVENWTLLIRDNDVRVWFDDFDSPMSPEDLRTRINKMKIG